MLTSFESKNMKITIMAQINTIRKSFLQVIFSIDPTKISFLQFKELIYQKTLEYAEIENYKGLDSIHIITAGMEIDENNIKDHIMRMNEDPIYIFFKQATVKSKNKVVAPEEIEEYVNEATKELIEAYINIGLDSENAQKFNVFIDNKYSFLSMMLREKTIFCEEVSQEILIKSLVSLFQKFNPKGVELLIRDDLYGEDISGVTNQKISAAKKKNKICIPISSRLADKLFESNAQDGGTREFNVFITKFSYLECNSLHEIDAQAISPVLTSLTEKIKLFPNVTHFILRPCYSSCLIKKSFFTPHSVVLVGKQQDIEKQDVKDTQFLVQQKGDDTYVKFIDLNDEVNLIKLQNVPKVKGAKPTYEFEIKLVELAQEYNFPPLKLNTIEYEILAKQWRSGETLNEMLKKICRATAVSARTFDVLSFSEQSMAEAFHKKFKDEKITNLVFKAYNNSYFAAPSGMISHVQHDHSKYPKAMRTKL